MRRSSLQLPPAPAGADLVWTSWALGKAVRKSEATTDQSGKRYARRAEGRDGTEQRPQKTETGLVSVALVRKWVGWTGQGDRRGRWRRAWHSPPTSPPAEGGDGGAAAAAAMAIPQAACAFCRDGRSSALGREESSRMRNVKKMRQRLDVVARSCWHQGFSLKPLLAGTSKQWF